MEIRSFGHKEWLEICVIFFRVGVEEITRNKLSYDFIHVNS